MTIVVHASDLYTVHIHAIKEKHLSQEYRSFWGEIMLECVLRAKKHDPLKSSIHIIFCCL